MIGRPPQAAEDLLNAAAWNADELRDERRDLEARLKNIRTEIADAERDEREPNVCARRPQSPSTANGTTSSRPKPGSTASPPSRDAAALS